MANTQSLEDVLRQFLGLESIQELRDLLERLDRRDFRVWNSYYNRSKEKSTRLSLDKWGGLNNIFENSGWFSARYKAGINLDRDCSGYLDSWVGELEERIFSSSSEERKKIESVEDVAQLMRVSGSDKALDLLKRVYEKSPDTEVRVWAGIRTAEVLNPKSFNSERSFSIGAEVYGDELDRRKKLNNNSLEIVFRYSNDPRRRKIAGNLLGKNEGDTLGNELQHGTELNERELKLVYDSATEPHFIKQSGIRLGYSEIEILERQIERDYNPRIEDCWNVFLNGKNSKNREIVTRILADNKLVNNLDIVENRFRHGEMISDLGLRGIYNFSRERDMRKKAGKALDYSPLRIWVNEHLVTATISGIAAIGAASGLGYMLYQYLAR